MIPFFTDASVVPAFKIGEDPRNDWIRWKRVVERYLEANDITDDQEKFNLLLVLGGIDLQDQYDKIIKYEVTVPTPTDPKVLAISHYQSAIYSLEAYFAPKTNKRYERHILRAIRQEETETFDDFVNRVVGQANKCEYSDVHDMVIDQITEGCASTDLRKKILSEEMTFADVCKQGKALERIKAQNRSFEGKHTQPEAVQRIQRAQALNKRRRCDNCNHDDHETEDQRKCPATKAQCLRCRGIGHYKACCPSKKTYGNLPDKQWKRPYQDRDEPRKKTRWNRPSVYRLEDGDAPETLRFEVGGIKTDMVVDSGSTANIITKSTFDWLKRMQAAMMDERSAEKESRMFQAYGESGTIAFEAAFETEIKIPGQDSGVWAHVLVAEKGQSNLLSKGSAFALGVLKIGYPINSVNPIQKTDVERQEFPKIAGISAKIFVDATVEPVAQPIRRLPIVMEEEVEELIQKMLSQGIIEKVDHPTGWISPLVPVRKGNGKLRLCVDLRAVNKAVKTEKYPMPNIEDALASIRRIALVSKIDLESAFYHVELEPASRDLTTFITRSGLYRFCRLVFGIKCAPEIFQKIMQQLFGDIKGVIIYLDDLLIVGATTQEHDAALKEVMRRVKMYGLEINEAKSVFGTDETTFLGHKISTRGFSATEEKIEAVKNLKPPSSTAELKSLLGLMTFLGEMRLRS